MGDRLMPATPSFGQGTPVTSRALNTAFANLQAQISSPSAGSLTGTTLAANVVNSSLTSVGTLVSGSIPATLLTGTVASARISGSYTGITGLGTLTSLTIDGPTSTAFTLGDTGFTGYSGITGDKGHLLVGNSVGDTAIYLRSSGAGNLYLGASNSNTLQVGNGTVTVYGTMNATTFSGSGSSLTSLNASNLASGTVASARLSGGYTGITGLGTLTTLLAGKVCSTATVAAANDTGSFSVRGNTSFPAVMSFHRAGAYAVNFGLSTSNVMELGGWSAGTIKFSVNMTNGDVTAQGAVYANNWYRSYGTTGWYNQTYESGIYSKGTKEVWTYNASRFIASNNSSSSAYSAQQLEVRSNDLYSGGSVAGISFHVYGANAPVLRYWTGTGAGLDVGNEGGTGYWYMGANNFVTRSSMRWKTDIRRRPQEQIVEVGLRLLEGETAIWDSKDIEPIFDEENDCYVQPCAEQRELVKDDWIQRRHFNKRGYIVEELEKVFPEAVHYESDGKPSGIDYGVITTELVDILKLVVLQNDDQQRRIELLENKQRQLETA